MAEIPPGCVCLGPAPMRTRRARGCAVAACVGGKTSLLRQGAAQSATLAAKSPPWPAGAGSGFMGSGRTALALLPREFV